MPTPALTPPFRLYLLFFPDCGTCQKTKPEVRAWAGSHPWVKLVEVDLSVTDWKADSWTPKVVPTLVLLEPSGRSHVREHGATRGAVETWVRKACPRALARPPPAEAVVDAAPPKEAKDATDDGG